MAKFDCEICRGRGQVRLPIYRRAQISTLEDMAQHASIDESFKTYPCPECALTAPTDRIAIVDHHSQVIMHAKQHPRVMETAHGTCAHMITDRLLREGFFRFDVGETSDLTMSFPLTATLGVVAPKQVATIEQRQREHQEKIANEITTEAIAEIDNWGSHFGHSEILKRDARRLIGDALKTVLSRYPKEPT